MDMTNEEALIVAKQIVKHYKTAKEFLKQMAEYEKMSEECAISDDVENTIQNFKNALNEEL